MAVLKLTYASSAAITNAIESLGTSSSKVAGYESDVLDNTTNVYLDYLISGKITTGTTPTVNKTIEVWAIGILDDSTWPDVFDGTTSAETIVRDALFAYGRLLTTIVVTATSDVGYSFGPVSLASLFGGVVPKKTVFFVTHDTAVNLNSTAGNQKLWATGVYATST